MPTIVISTHVQDAPVQPSDIIWRQGEKRLVVGMSRLDWEQTLAGETEQRRLVSALRFDRVLACKSRNIDLATPEAVLDLVGIEFHPQTAAMKSPAAARCCCLPRAAPSASTSNVWNAS